MSHYCKVTVAFKIGPFTLSKRTYYFDITKEEEWTNTEPYYNKGIAAWASDMKEEGNLYLSYTGAPEVRD